MATLYDLAMKYLQQGLPSISGIFPSTIPPIGGAPPPGTNPPTQPGFPAEGIINTESGDNFTVYNPDPTRLRTSDQYSPFNARRFYARPDSNVGIPSGILSDSKFLYGDQVQLPGILGAGQDFIKSFLPVNRRAILENEALGAGIALDDIGRIVQGSGDYNTAENVMAGYNLAKITPETIQKRRDMINAKMKDPEQKAARLKALDDFENKMFGKGGITDLSDGIFDQKTRAKGDIPLTDQIAMNKAKLDFQKLVDEGEEEQDIIEQIKALQTGGKPPFPGLSFNPGLNFGVSPLGEFDTTGIASITPKEEIIVPPEKPSIGGGGGGSPAQQIKTRQKDLSGSGQKDFGPYQDAAKARRETRSRDLDRGRGGVGRSTTSAPTNVGNPFGY